MIAAQRLSPTGLAGARQRARNLPPRLRPHWPLLIVLGVGFVVRLLAMIAYTPALLFPDSWGYISSAYAGTFVGLPRLRPIGYSILLRLLSLPGHSLLEVVAFQHLAGIAVGLVIYATLRRMQVSVWAATAAAALVLLDGYAITLEQYVMSDTFFGVSLLAAALTLSWPRLAARRSGALALPDERIWLRALLSGLLLAFAALVREAAPFTIPVFLIYLAWIRAGWRAFAAFVLAVVIPLSVYSAAIDSKYRVFGITASSGWTLYGRVGGFAKCDGLKIAAAARPLCETKAQRASHPSAPDWYIWGPSPATRAFDPDNETVGQAATTNAVLRAFSEKIIRHQPLAFVGATLGDFLRYFTPGATAYNDAVSATSLPLKAADEARGSPATQKRDLPGLHVVIRSPAGVVRWYRSVLHVPRPVLALLALAALAALIVRVPARREILLLSGTGVCLLLGTAATGGFGLRYLIPAVPLLAIGGALAATQIAARTRAGGARVNARPAVAKSATMDL